MKEVKKISISDIYEYITCPLKRAFSDKDKNYTILELYDYAGKESLKTLFSFLSVNRSWSRAYSEAMEKFNYIWFKNIDKLNEKFNKTDVKFSQSYIVTKAKSIIDFSKDEIVSVNFPLEYSINSSTIVTDNSDLLVINTNNNFSKKKFRSINFYNRLPFENKRYFNLKAGYFRLAIQSYLNRNHYRDFSYELRPLNGKDEIYDCNPHFLQPIRAIINNVVTGINENVIYATTNDEACKVCPYKSKCTLSLINKL